MRLLILYQRVQCSETLFVIPHKKRRNDNAKFPKAPLMRIRIVRLDSYRRASRRAEEEVLFCLQYFLLSAY